MLHRLILGGSLGVLFDLVCRFTGARRHAGFAISG
jgi:hypothetical protein